MFFSVPWVIKVLFGPACIKINFIQIEFLDLQNGEMFNTWNVNQDAVRFPMPFLTDPPCAFNPPKQHVSLPTSMSLSEYVSIWGGASISGMRGGSNFLPYWLKLYEGWGREHVCMTSTIDIFLTSTIALRISRPGVHTHALGLGSASIFCRHPFQSFVIFFADNLSRSALHMNASTLSPARLYTRHDFLPLE